MSAFKKTPHYACLQSFSHFQMFTFLQFCTLLTLKFFVDSISKRKTLALNIWLKTSRLMQFIWENIIVIFLLIWLIWRLFCWYNLFPKTFLLKQFSNRLFFSSKKYVWKIICDDIIYLRKHWRSMQMFSDDSRKVPSISEMALWRTRA